MMESGQELPTYYYEKLKKLTCFDHERKYHKCQKIFSKNYYSCKITSIYIRNAKGLKKIWVSLV